MASTGQAGSNGIQRVPASLYNNPDDTDFKHVAGTTPGTEDPFSLNGTFADRVRCDNVARGESSASDREEIPPKQCCKDADVPAVTSFTVPEQESCSQRATTEEGPTHPQHVHTSPPAHDPLPPPPVNSLPVDPGALPEFVPVVTGVCCCTAAAKLFDTRFTSMDAQQCNPSSDVFYCTVTSLWLALA